MLDTVTRRCAYLGVALLLMCAVVNGADIATRRTLNLGFVGLVDLTQLLVMACAFLCIPLTFLREAQIEVDLFSRGASGRAGSALRCIGSLACALLMGAIGIAVVQALQQTLQHGDRSATLALPLWWYWAPVAFGCALAVIACLAVALRHGRRALAA